MLDVIMVLIGAVIGVAKIMIIWVITGALVVFAIWAGASITEAIEKEIKKRKGRR